MNALTNVFSAVLSASWHVSWLILAVLLMRPALRRRIPASLLFATWIIVALGLLIPFGIPARWSPFNLTKAMATAKLNQTVAPSAEAPLVYVPSPTPVEILTNAPRFTPPVYTLTAKEVLALLWAAGMAGLVGVRAWTSVNFRRRLGRSQLTAGSRLPEMIAQQARRMGLSVHPAVLISDAVNNPALFGLFRPCLILPVAFAEKLSDEELRLVLMHELGHWRRRDLLAQTVIQCAQVLHWFNPLVWLARRLSRLDCELACDEFVLQRAPSAESQIYGFTLLKVLGVSRENRRVPAMLGMLENKQDLKQRNRMIAEYQRRSRTRTFIGVGLLISLGAICATREAQAQSPVEAKTEPSPPIPSSDGSADKKSEPSIITIRISDQDTVSWNGEIIDMVEVKSRLESYKDQAVQPRVLISYVEKAKLGSTVRILDIVRKAGIQQVSVETRAHGATSADDKKDENRPQTPAEANAAQSFSGQSLGGPQDKKSGSPDITIWISDQDTVYWNGDPISVEEVAPRLEEYKSKTAQPRLLVTSDDKAKFDIIVRILDTVRKAGLQQVSVETRVVRSQSGSVWQELQDRDRAKYRLYVSTLQRTPQKKKEDTDPMSGSDELNQGFADGVAASVGDPLITADDVRREAAPYVSELLRTSQSEKEYHDRLRVLDDDMIRNVFARSRVARESQAEGRAIIAVDTEGAVSINGTVVSDDQLLKMLQVVHKVAPNIPILIRTTNAPNLRPRDLRAVILDATAELHRLAFVMDVCRQAGLNKFSLQSQ